ncbi:MAG: amidase [Gemmatimonadales bacterium]|nr:amidase [Gemmatimonadales bacterium]
MPTPAARRAFLARCAELGLGASAVPTVLWARAEAGLDVTRDTIRAAEELVGVQYGDAERDLMLETLKQQRGQVEALRKVALPNAVLPAVRFDPRLPGWTPPAPARRRRVSRVALPDVRDGDPSLAWRPVTELSALLVARRITSRGLTELALDRLRRLDPTLHCVVTLLEDRALARADAADAELRAGRRRGPLHGIPWGAKDLLAVAGAPTTWGAAPYREQRFNEDAEVVRRLDAAGAVLVAKLSLGELAQGDTWFGGQTRNPWNPAQGSSGSSAGSASAVAAGCVPFAIGSETLGSISSPATRCGVTGLRPTFGRVPRTGAMALSWTMDKLGPLARSVEDCALVLEAIHGADGRDPVAVSYPFVWDAERPLAELRVGVARAVFDLPATELRDGKPAPVHATKPFDDAALEVLGRLGARLTDVTFPDAPYAAMRLVLMVEAAAAFDELVRGGDAARLAQQGAFNWPNTLRAARFIPGLDYVNAMRARTLAMEAWDRLFRDVDVIVVPTGAMGNPQLVATNLTGHPAVIVPNGLAPTSDADPTPTPVSLTFLGRLHGEADLLRVAHAYQQATAFHRARPPV